MLIAVVSDIHANLTALERVLQEIDRLRPDALWCLGDVVGYGPQPQACADIMRARADVCLAGNHDLAVTGRLDLNKFNPVARQAILWHRSRLTPETMSWLGSLPARTEAAGVTLAHGSPRRPEWEYVDDETTAAANYSAFDTAICLIGHAHKPQGWRLSGAGGRGSARLVTAAAGLPLALDLRHKWLLNPGSVGQPRDYDPQAAFALLDTETWQWRWQRVAYDVATVERAIREAGLPQVLGQRLHLGW